MQINNQIIFNKSMRKKGIFFAVVFGCLVIVGLGGGVTAKAAVYTVGSQACVTAGDCDFATINGALSTTTLAQDDEVVVKNSYDRDFAGENLDVTANQRIKFSCEDDTFIIGPSSGDDNTNYSSSTHLGFVGGSEVTGCKFSNVSIFVSDGFIFKNNSFLSSAVGTVMSNPFTSPLVIENNTAIDGIDITTYPGATASTSIKNNELAGLVVRSDIESAGSVVISNNNFEVADSNLINLIGYNIDFNNNQVVYNNSAYSDISGGIMAIAPYGSMSITSNTLTMATVSNREHFRAISGGFDEKTSSLLLVGNKIDFRNATGGDTMPIRIDSYNTTTVITWNLIHNTFFYNQDDQDFIQLNNRLDGGKITVNANYNIFDSTGDGQVRRVFNITNDYDNSDTYASVSADYNDYYNLNPNSGNNDGRVDVIAVRRCDAGNCDDVEYSYYDSGDHSILSQPVFQSADVSILKGWTLVPSSALLDVNGIEDIGAVSGERPDRFLVGDQTWFKNLTNTTTDLALYSTSSMFGDSSNTSTWTYVGTNPSDLLNGSLKDGDAVAIFPGTYGPVNISNSLNNIVIGNYAWAMYLPLQLQNKIWGLTLANSGNYSGTYDCEGVQAALLDLPISEDNPDTIWETVQQNCQAQEIVTGVENPSCASKAAYINYVCAIPTSESEKVVFNATSGNAFTASGLASSTIFGLTFANASTTAFNAIAPAHYYSVPVVTAATVSQHYYTADGHDYTYVMDNGGDAGVTGLNFWTYYNQLPIAVTSTDLTRAMTVMPSPVNLDLVLMSLDMDVISGGEVTGTVYASVYIHEGLTTTTFPAGFSVDCLAYDTFTYANGSYTYHAPTCADLGTVTTNVTPAINLTEQATPYTEIFDGGNRVQANSTMMIFDVGQFGGGGSEEEPGMISASASTNVTDYLGSDTPSNWHLMLANLDSGLMEESANGEITHMAVYLRADALSEGMALSDFADYMISQFSIGASIACLKENVFTYSNGAFSYNPPTECSSVTVNGTPAINLIQSGYAGLKLTDSHDNDLYGNNAQNNGYGIWLDGNSYNNTFVGSITPNLATAEEFWEGSLSGQPDIEDSFVPGIMRATSILTYAYSSSTLLASLGGIFSSPDLVVLSDNDLTIDTPFNITTSAIADVKSTVSSTGHNSFYNVDADLTKIITESTAPLNMYYRGRVHATNSSNAALNGVTATLSSADNTYSYSGTTDSNGYTDYSNNFLAASLYYPDNATVTSGGYNPYTASASSYTTSANLASANQTFNVYSSSNSHSSSGGAGYGPNNVVAIPTIKVPPYVKSFDKNTGKVTLYAEVLRASQMAIAFDPSFTNISWVKYTTTTDLGLPGSYGEKKIYIKYRTPTGGTSLVYIVTVNWDKTGVESTSQTTTVVTTNNQDTKVEKPVTNIPQPTKTIYVFKRTLKLGAAGDDVRALQQILREAKYFTYYKNTGYFGAVTKTALIKYQTAKGLKATGVVDSATLEVLNG